MREGKTVMQHIFLVEDDADIRETILYALESAGFTAAGFEHSDHFFAYLAANPTVPALIILDIMLPGEDGLVLLKKLRQMSSYQSLPVLMLTAKSSEIDKVKGLDLGADDYMTKPFGVMELISRVKALLRRTGQQNTDNTMLTYENIQLQHAKRKVLVDGTPITLTFKEYELLYLLMSNSGVALRRNKILESVWGYEYEGESRTLDMHIKSLRQKLGVASDYIITIRNVGYRFGA